MRLEDLVENRKYRHPYFNFDLTFLEIGGENSYVFCHKECEHRHKSILIYLQKEDFTKLTEVREPIKKEKVSYSFVNPKLSPNKTCDDIIIGLRVSSTSESLNDLLAERFCEVNEIIVKTISTSIELSEEDIKKELQNG